MAAGLKATLPPLLKSYLPEYEPPTRPSPGKAATKSVIDSRSVIHADDDILSTERALSQQTSKESRRHTKGQGSDTVSRTKKTVKSPSREKTLDALKRKQKQFGRKFDDWQQVKQEAHDEEERRLHVKIVLQRELIHAQDEYTHEKQRERESEAIKRLRERRAEKQRVNNLLRDICLQSLDDDRQRREEQRAAQRNKKKTAESAKSGINGASSICRLSRENLALVRRETSFEGDKHPGEMTSSMSSRSSIASTHAAHMMSPHGSILQEENESEEEDREAERPWYVEQLYQLFGQDADDFLHPKMKTESKKTALRDLPLTQQRECTDLGAGGLWTLLREDSYLKLMQEDSTISSELKTAYSSFIRQCLVHRKKPIERNFCAEADVPDLQRLMDHTRIREAQNFSHKVELMYRASRNNKDRSLVLMHNNPVTELPTSMTDDGDGIAQFLPSLTDDDGLDGDGDSVYVYKKWLQSEHPHSTRGDDPSTHKTSKESLTERSNDDWQFLVPEMKKAPKMHRYKFLKERDIRCKGEFSDNMKAKFDKDDVVMVKLPPKPGLAAVGSEDSRTWNSQRVGRTAGSQTAREALPSRNGHQKPRRTQSEMAYNDATLWEPLTLSALMEYKKMRTVFGTGDFAHGRVPLWPILNEQAASSTKHEYWRGRTRSSWTTRTIPTYCTLPAWKRTQFPLIRDSIPGIPKKGIQTDEEKKALTMEYIEQTYPHDISTHAYTDGSAEEAIRSRGGGILLNLKDGRKIKQAIPTGRYSTNYKAEAQAMKTAATILVEQRDAIQNKVVIFSDALSVMQTLSNPQNKELNVLSSAVSTAERHQTDSAPVDPSTRKHPGKQGSGQIDKGGR
ncbi:hypothetical protein LSAT2_016298 [Lamellibrachia satsuma]|nr:hypothetical protein LSAT2_016298 [Lamellibrachia satsuma]